MLFRSWFPFYYTIEYPNIFPPINSNYFIHQYVNPASNYYEYTHVADSGVQPTISWLVRQHKYYIKKAKEKGLIYGVINQLNSDENNINGSGSNEWGIREPTNEEISMILNTSMAYGAKVLLEFSYTSRLQDADKQTYNWGLTSIEPYFETRTENYYGQNKWAFVKELNSKLRAVGDYMYPLNQPNEHLVHDKTLTVNDVSYQAYCDECGYANYSFINDISSLAPLLSGQNPCSPSQNPGEYYDCEYERYWELGFFKPNPNSLTTNDRSKYVYAVNKRTYPVNTKNNLGDRRILKIKFNSSGLQGFNNWVIKDAVKDSVLATFSKQNNDYITIASFEPGEGKLYKIAPVMQEGGTLVCDENIENLNPFDCKDNVYGNGHNITIGHRYRGI